MSNLPATRIWLILSSVSALIFLLNIDYTAVNIALVSISEEIPSDLNTLQWLLSGYVLTWAAFVVPAGRFADRLGKRHMLNLGVCLFILGSAFASLAHRIDILIAGRILQGIGAALFTPPCYGLIFTIMPLSKRSFGMGILAGVSGFGLAAGPTCAGYLVQHLSWRWIFYINIPLGLLVILTTFLFVPKEVLPKNDSKIDLLGAFLLALGLGFVMFGLNQIEVWGLKDLRTLSMLCAGLSALLIFWLWDAKQKNQTLPKDLLKNKPFMVCMIAVILNVYNFSLILIMVGIYLQNTLHLSGYDAGMIFLSMTLTIGLLSPIGGKIGDKIEIRLPITAGFLSLSLATVMMSFMDGSSSHLFIKTALFFAGLGLGLSWPTLNAAMMRAVDAKAINTASALFTMATMIANTLGVILSTSFLVLFGQGKLIELLSKSTLSLSAAEETTLLSLIQKVEHTADQLSQFSPERIPELLYAVDQAFVYGLSCTMWIGSALTALGAVMIFTKLKNLNTTSAHPTVMIA